MQARRKTKHCPHFSSLSPPTPDEFAANGWDSVFLLYICEQEADMV
jgi:hypothetical protein